MPGIEHDEIAARFVQWRTFFVREILECGIPPTADKHHLVRDLRILNSMLIVAMLLCPILGAFWAGVASNGFVALYATAFAAWFTTLLFLRRTKSPVVGGRLACLALYLLIVGSAFLLGGASSFALAWVMVMPVAAAVCVGKADLWFWAGASSVTVLSFQSLSDATRGSLISDAAMQLDDPSSLTSLVAGVVVVAILTSVWHAFQSGLEKRLDASLRETQAEVRQKQILVDIATVSSSEESVDAASQLFAERLRSSFNLAGVRYWAVSREASCVRLASADPLLLLLQEGVEATESVRRCAAESKRIIIETAFEANVCVPVLEGNRVTGVLEVLGDADSEAVAQYLGIVRQMALRLREVGLREATARAVWNEANQDHLTQLPNRRAFHGVLRNAIIDAGREKRRAGLLFVDLNGFKRINDSLGHGAGDEVLRRVSRRLKTCIRLSDAICEAGVGTGPQISRVGGDEFTILLDEIRYSEDAELVAKRALSALTTPISLPDGDVQVGASIGIAIYPDDAQTMDDLVRCADAAMYTAKRRGTSGFARHHEQNGQVDELAFQSEIESALAGDDMVMHYQPIFSCDDGRLLGAEGLMRWFHPERGSIGPEFFVPLAESLGLIGELGRIGFGQALKWFSESWEELPEEFRLALNLSPLQIEDTEFVSWFEEAVPSFGLRYDQIELEVEETALLTDAPTTRKNILRLAEIGVGIALDDFGTGQSSLSLLKRFPIGRIKLDRTFVAGLPDSVDDAAIASAVLSLAGALEVPIVAEGVEDEAQQAFLAERGCDEMQGFLLGRPISGVDFKSRYDC